MTAITAQQFLLPDLGEGLTEAVVVEWKVAVGETVQIDQPVVEVESAKSVVELPVPFAGEVLEIHVAPGDRILLGEPLLTVGDAGAVATEQPPAPQADAAGATTSGTAETRTEESSGAVLIGYGTREEARPRGPRTQGRFGGRARGTTADAATAAAPATVAAPSAVPSSTPSATPAQASAGPAASGASCATPTAECALLDPARDSPVKSPLVRRLARDAGFDARQLRGSGPRGLVLRTDVEQAIETRRSDQTAAAPAARTAPAASPSSTAGSASAGSSAPGTAAPGRAASPAAAAAEDRRIPIEGMRAIVAEHMSRSHSEVPKATIWRDVDATALLETKARLEALTNERFSLTTLISRFVVAGLGRYPALNASFDAATTTIIEHAEVNLGIAAQTPRGLAVPVVHGAGSMSLRQLRDGIGEIVAESSRGHYSPAQLAGGTFTVNNYGSFTVDGASPIITMPQAGMLGLGRLMERPWVVDHELAVRTVMTLSFVFDHRVCDGDVASGFLGFVAGCIEEPLSVMPEL